MQLYGTQDSRCGVRGTYHRVLQRGSMAWWYRRSASSSLVGYWRDYIGSVRYGARALA